MTSCMWAANHHTNKWFFKIGSMQLYRMPFYVVFMYKANLKKTWSSKIIIKSSHAQSLDLNPAENSFE